MKRVAQYDPCSGELLVVFPSAAAAARAVPKGNRGNIISCARGRLSVACGYRWRYWTGPIPSPEALRKRRVLRRLEDFWKTHGPGWSGAVARASRGKLTADEVHAMRGAEKFSMEKWDALEKALDQLDSNF